jgi:cellulose synthase/poly-beta-1,6-N-acetylglucosamine synthase-like glycosyltransferase
LTTRSMFLEKGNTSDSSENTSVSSTEYQYYLVKKALRSGRKQSKCSFSISETILLEDHLYISPKKVSHILSEYGSLLFAKEEYCFFLALVLSFLISYLSVGPSWVSFVFGCALVFPVMVSVLLSRASLNLFAIDIDELAADCSSDVDQLHSTAVLIVSRNEPFSVARMTFDSAINLLYPEGKKEVIVVDNSDESYFDYIKWKNYVSSFELGGKNEVKGVTVRFIHRNGTEGFKPRNIDLAYQATNAKFIMYLDVDSTLAKDALIRIIPMFERDEKIGYVQMHTIPTNALGKSALAMVHSIRTYFLRRVNLYFSHSSHCLFYGHNAVWRRKTLDEIGECLEHRNGEVVVTEDLSMTFRAKINGYYGITTSTESGEWVPESLRQTEAMWLRWTVGTYQVFAMHFFANLKKFSYLELIGWLQHIGLYISYGLLPVFIICGLVFNSQILMWLAIITLFPEIINAVIGSSSLSLGGIRTKNKYSNCYYAFFLLGAFINWVQFIGIINFLTGKKQGWVPTGKSKEEVLPLAKSLLARLDIISFGLFCYVYSLYSLIFVSNGIVNNALVAFCGFYGLNYALSIFKFSRSAMQEETKDAVLNNNIESYTGFYRGNGKVL